MVTPNFLNVKSKSLLIMTDQMINSSSDCVVKRTTVLLDCRVVSRQARYSHYNTFKLPMEPAIRKSWGTESFLLTQKLGFVSSVFGSDNYREMVGIKLIVSRVTIVNAPKEIDSGLMFFSQGKKITAVKTSVERQALKTTVPKYKCLR